MASVPRAATDPTLAGPLYLAVRDEAGAPRERFRNSRANFAGSRIADCEDTDRSALVRASVSDMGRPQRQRSREGDYR
jgi:hypothetical protein